MAQHYLEPIIGYQTDLNNTKDKFHQFNTAIQYSFSKNRHYEFILQLQKSWPLSYHGNDSGFTANPALPLYATAKKTMRPSSFSFAIGHRLSLFRFHSANIFSVVLYTGIVSQKIAVAYEYDKANYTILNPDETIKRTGIYISAGLQYMRLLNFGRLFIQVNAATPPLTNKIDRSSSFYVMAPLSFNAGFSVPFKNTKHAKK